MSSSFSGAEAPKVDMPMTAPSDSVNCPYHLADAPAVKCYINTYDPRPVTLELLLDKLASGADAFTGVPPTDAYCGFFDTRI